jgi:hypothetical protein
MPRRFLRLSSRRFFLWCSLTFLMSLYFCFKVVRLDLDPCDFFTILSWLYVKWRRRRWRI